MDDRRKTYWFPAKRYGWGWGPPRTWQGWLVLAVFALLYAVSAARFLYHGRVIAFVASAIILTLCLIGICLVKGEKPRWRWGKDKQES